MMICRETACAISSKLNSSYKQQCILSLAVLSFVCHCHCMEILRLSSDRVAISFHVIFFCMILLNYFMLYWDLLSNLTRSFILDQTDTSN